MADVNGNAKLFREMQSADARRQEMRENILAKAKPSGKARGADPRQRL